MTRGMVRMCGTLVLLASMLAETVSLATGRPDEAEPATIENFLKAVDLANLPRMAGAKSSYQNAAMSSYAAPGTPDEAVAFYVKTMQSHGFRQTASPADGSAGDPQRMAQFEKDGYCVVVFARKNDGKSGVDVTVQSLGNVDPRKLPRPIGATMLNDYRTNVRFTVAQTPDELEAFCKREFAAAGWKEQVDDTAAFHRKEGRYLLNFTKNAMKTMVVIHTNADKRTEALYSTQLHENAELQAATPTGPSAKPATPKEAIAAIDFRKFPRLGEQKPRTITSAGVFYSFEGKVDDPLPFYRKHLTEAGWKEVETPGLDMPESKIYFFEKNGFRVQLGVGVDRKKNLIDVSIANQGNVDVRKLPRPKDAHPGSSEHAHIHFTTSSTPDEAADFCRREFKELGWDESGSKENPNGKVLRFFQNGIQIVVEISVTTAGRTGVSYQPRLIGLR